jgi:hypothetical protein
VSSARRLPKNRYDTDEHRRDPGTPRGPQDAGSVLIMPRRHWRPASRRRRRSPAREALAPESEMAGITLDEAGNIDFIGSIATMDPAIEELLSALPAELEPHDGFDVIANLLLANPIRGSNPLSPANPNQMSRRDIPIAARSFWCELTMKATKKSIRTCPPLASATRSFLPLGRASLLPIPPGSRRASRPRHDPRSTSSPKVSPARGQSRTTRSGAVGIS